MLSASQSLSTCNGNRISKQSGVSIGEELRPSKSPQVVIVAQSFPPFNHSGTIRSAAFARWLPSYGIRTTVLTDQVDQDLSRHPGLTIGVDENWDDNCQPYEVRRMNWDLSPAPSRLSRLMLRFPLASSAVTAGQRHRFLRRVTPLTDALIAWNDVDVIYGSAAPPESVLLAKALAERHARPLVLDLRDPWSYCPPMKYRHYVDFLVERQVERRTLAAADAVITTTKATAELVIRKLRVPPHRVHVIANGYDERDFAGAVGLPPADRFIVTHAGEMALRDLPPPTIRGRVKAFLGMDYRPLRTDWQTRSPRYLLAAATKFLQENPSARQRLMIQLIGVGDTSTCSAIKSFPFPECLRVSGRVSPEAAVEACHQSHLLVLMQNRYFLDGEEFCVAIPGKLYTYLRTGRRILACVPKSEISDVVRSTKSGVSVRPDSIEEIKVSLANEYDNWLAGRDVTNSVSVQQFDRRVGAEQLAQLLRSIRSDSQFPPA
jgi:glycosyltransferase involved in cell wall biosynthesis